MKIRKAKRKDSDDILRLLNSDSNLHASESDKATPADVKQYLFGGTHWVYICEIDGEVAGVIIVEAYRIAKYLYLTYIVTNKNFTKKSVATKLFKHVENLAKKKKYYLIGLFAKRGNIKMKKFMKKLNYSQEGDYLFYYKELK